MVPLIEVTDEVLEGMNQLKIPYTLNSNLERILKKDETGKPILELTPLYEVAVNTKTQKEYAELMRVYETGNWKWVEKSLPTKLDSWIKYKEDTCVAIENNFKYIDKSFYLKKNWDVISIQKFYKIQGITPEMLKEINKYFGERK